MCWVYNWPRAYIMGFGPTVLLNIDLLYLFASHRDQLIDFVHCASYLLWVLANGIWAYGEMYTELPPPGVSEDDFIPEEDWDSYNWPWLPPTRHFGARYASGVVFAINGLMLAAFYIYWIVVTIRCPPVEEDIDDDDEFLDRAQRAKAQAKADAASSTTIELSNIATI
jgi:hypothetical protein